MQLPLLKSASVLFIHVVIHTDFMQETIQKRGGKGIHIKSSAGVNSYCFTEALLKLTKPRKFTPHEDLGQNHAQHSQAEWH